MTFFSPPLVGFKIKTTSPEKYRVRPSSGVLSPGKFHNNDKKKLKSVEVLRELNLAVINSLSGILTFKVKVPVWKYT